MSEWSGKADQMRLVTTWCAALSEQYCSEEYFGRGGADGVRPS